MCNMSVWIPTRLNERVRGAGLEGFSRSPHGSSATPATSFAEHARARLRVTCNKAEETLSAEEVYEHHACDRQC